VTRPADPPEPGPPDFGPPDPPGGDARLDALRANLTAVRARLAAACAAAGRRPADVTLIAVTKTFPAADVVRLADLGVRDVAENRDQEARAKHAGAAARRPGLRWHYVGQLQRNKARSVVRYASAVHSVDRPDLADALGVAASRLRDARLDVLVQVSLDPGDPAGRGGAEPAAVDELAALVAAQPALRLRGVMAVAPLGADPDPAFALLADVAAGVRRRHPEAAWISAGMSGDLESAIRHGATHVRVGTALLGKRVTPGGRVSP
jgi:pyridoxal phosphate enzyme (YggS family)